MVAAWKVLLGGAAVVGAAVAVSKLAGDDENKLPDGGSGKDGAEDEEGHLTPDKPPRPEPPIPPLGADVGWPSNVHLLKTAAEFSTWAVVDVIDGKTSPAARGSVYFGYSREWSNFEAELDALRGLAVKNDVVRFIIFDFADSRAASGHPEQTMAYVATSVGPEGQPRTQAPFFANSLTASRLPNARWMKLIEWARIGPDSEPVPQPAGVGEAPPSSGNYGPNARTLYLPDHPRGPHWVVTICEREQLPDGKVTRCRWYLFKGKHAGALSQANYSSTDYGKPWAGSLSSHAGARDKAIAFIDEYNEAHASYNPGP